MIVVIELPEMVKAKDVSIKCIENGLVVLTAKTKVRLLPPLNISFSDLEKGLDILLKSIKECM
jgi:acetylornithine/N-succinyldiaminopimelate aminotransferase